MGFMDRWLRQPAASVGPSRTPGPADDYWYGEAPHRTGAGIYITPEVAIKSAAVFACVSKIAKIMGSLPCCMYQVTKEGQTADPDNPLEELLRYQPNMNDTAIDFWSQMMWHSLLRGTAYAEIMSTPRKAVAALVPLHPNSMKVDALPNGRYKFTYRDPLMMGAQRVINQDNLFRFAGLISGGIQGMGICSTGDEVLAVTAVADQYASRVFSNSLNVGIVLEHPGKLSEAAQENLVKSLLRRFSGPSNAHRPMVLQEGMKANKGFTQTAEDAQLLEARKWQTLEVCRIFDMPPTMIGINEGVVGASAEEQSLNFVRYTLQPWAKRIEQALRRDVIPVDAGGKVNVKAEFNFQSLLRGNAQARSEYFSKALGSGGSPAWMSVNEVRALDGLNRYDDPLFDKPALGTNPKQTPEDGSADKWKPANDNGNEAPADSEDPAQEKLPPKKAKPKSYEERCAVLIAKEVTVLRKYVARHADDADALRLAVGSFYRSHVSCVMQLIGVDKAAARIYCKVRETRFANASDILAAIDDLEENGLRELR